MIKEFIDDLKAFGGLPMYGFAIIFAVVYAPSLAWQLVVGILIAYMITSILRLLFFRVRPDKQRYRSWVEKIDAGSFPSLHAMRSALLGTLVYLTVRTTLVFVLVCIAIVLTGIARVFQKRHFVSDVIAGAVFGVALGLTLNFFIS